MDVVNFYNDRFQVGLTTEEKEDLVAFLENALAIARFAVSCPRSPQL